jgi:hypothetical protein
VVALSDLALGHSSRWLCIAVNPAVTTQSEAACTFKILLYVPVFVHSDLTSRKEAAPRNSVTKEARAKVRH